MGKGLSKIGERHQAIENLHPASSTMYDALPTKTQGQEHGESIASWCMPAGGSDSADPQACQHSELI